MSTPCSGSTNSMSGCRPLCRAFRSMRPQRLSGATRRPAAPLDAQCCQASTSHSSVASISRRSSLALAVGAATLAAWDYELLVPTEFKYLETPFEVRERGPQPERSPVRARFESADGKELVYIIVRNAQVIKPTLLQVADLTQYGNPIEVAKLLLPRGSKLLAASSQQVQLPTRTTPLGEVAVPPKTYFSFEFTTPDKLHVAMTAAAQRGKVYVCGASTELQQWESAKARLRSTVSTFRLIPPVGASS